MLIDSQSNPTINDIVTVKLVSGEEIVGKLLEQSHDAITLAKPVLVALQPVNAKQMGLSFMPVLGSVEPDTTLQIPKTALALRAVKTSPSVKASYIQMTSSIITPGVGEIVI